MDLQSAFSLIKLNLVDTFVPSKQLLQWLLVKLQSYGKLLHRANECCFYSATMLNHRLRTGHNWVEIMTALSMISRIWYVNNFTTISENNTHRNAYHFRAISNFLIKQVCLSYEELYSVLNQLPVDSREKEWLSDEYKFPNNLHEWLSST